MAKREAQAQSIPPLVGELSPIARAEHALAARVEAYTEASEALRAEIEFFQSAVAEAEGRPAEPELRLIVSRETAELEAIGRAEEADGDRPTPAQIAEFFRSHELREDPDPESARAGLPAASAPQTRSLARERLYADIGGTIIGLSGAAALINFVLLK